MSISTISGDEISIIGKGLLKLVRWPNLLIIAFCQYLSAIFLVGPPELYLTYLKDPDLLFMALGTLCIAAAGYIINDYYDVKIDYINKPKKVVVGKVLKRRVAMFVHIGLNAMGILAGIVVSLKIAAINLIAATWLWGYSNQLKRMPLIGNFSVALLSGLAIAIVGVHYKSNSKLVYFYALLAFLVSLIREIIKDLEDLKGDASFGCRTLPVIWGIRKTKNFLYLLFLAFGATIIFLAYVMGNTWLYLYFSLLVIPGAYLVYRLSLADTISEFHQLSLSVKWFMLLGVFSMVLI